MNRSIISLHSLRYVPRPETSTSRITPPARRVPCGEASQPACRRPGGFSLVEVVVAVALIGILSAMVVPRISAAPFQTDSAVHTVTAALLSSQRLAVKRQHDVVVAFDETNRRIRIHEDRNRDGALDADERFRYVELQESVVFGLGGVTAPAGTEAISFSDEQGGMPAVTFRRNGSASQAGSIHLTSLRAMHGDHELDTRKIDVERATGRASWFHYTPSGWKRGL